MTAPCFAASLRLIWIDAFLAEGHDLNRRDLMQAFDIGVAQASLDLAEFKRLWPWRVNYAADQKRYVAGAHVRAIFPRELRHQVLSVAVAVKQARKAKGWT